MKRGRWMRAVRWLATADDPRIDVALAVVACLPIFVVLCIALAEMWMLCHGV